MSLCIFQKSFSPQHHALSLSPDGLQPNSVVVVRASPDKEVHIGPDFNAQPPVSEGFDVRFLIVHHASSIRASSPASLQSLDCFVNLFTPDTLPAQRLSEGVRNVYPRWLAMTPIA